MGVIVIIFALYVAGYYLYFLSRRNSDRNEQTRLTNFDDVEIHCVDLAWGVDERNNFVMPEEGGFIEKGGDVAINAAILLASKSPPLIFARSYDATFP